MALNLNKFDFGKVDFSTPTATPEQPSGSSVLPPIENSTTNVAPATNKPPAKLAVDEMAEFEKNNAEFITSANTRYGIEPSVGRNALNFTQLNSRMEQDGLKPWEKHAVQQQWLSSLKKYQSDLPDGSKKEILAKQIEEIENRPEMLQKDNMFGLGAYFESLGKGVDAFQAGTALATAEGVSHISVPDSELEKEIEAQKPELATSKKRVDAKMAEYIRDAVTKGAENGDLAQVNGADLRTMAYNALSKEEQAVLQAYDKEMGARRTDVALKREVGGTTGDTLNTLRGITLKNTIDANKHSRYVGEDERQEQFNQQAADGFWGTIKAFVNDPGAGIRVGAQSTGQNLIPQVAGILAGVATKSPMVYQVVSSLSNVPAEVQGQFTEELTKAYQKEFGKTDIAGITDAEFKTLVDKYGSNLHEAVSDGFKSASAIMATEALTAKGVGILASKLMDKAKISGEIIRQAKEAGTKVAKRDVVAKALGITGATALKLTGEGWEEAFGQMASNIALDKPLMEGVGQSFVMALAALENIPNAVAVSKDAANMSKVGDNVEEYVAKQREQTTATTEGGSKVVEPTEVIGSNTENKAPPSKKETANPTKEEKIGDAEVVEPVTQAQKTFDSIKEKAKRNKKGNAWETESPAGDLSNAEKNALFSEWHTLAVKPDYALNDDQRSRLQEIEDQFSDKDGNNYFIEALNAWERGEFNEDRANNRDGTADANGQPVEQGSTEPNGSGAQRGVEASEPISPTETEATTERHSQSDTGASADPIEQPHDNAPASDTTGTDGRTGETDPTRGERGELGQNGGEQGGEPTQTVVEKSDDGGVQQRAQSDSVGETLDSKRAYAARHGGVNALRKRIDEIQEQYPQAKDRATWVDLPDDVKTELYNATEAVAATAHTSEEAKALTTPVKRETPTPYYKRLLKSIADQLRDGDFISAVRKGQLFDGSLNLRGVFLSNSQTINDMYGDGTFVRPVLKEGVTLNPLVIDGKNLNWDALPRVAIPEEVKKKVNDLLYGPDAKADLTARSKRATDALLGYVIANGVTDENGVPYNAVMVKSYTDMGGYGGKGSRHNVENMQDGTLADTLMLSPDIVSHWVEVPAKNRSVRTSDTAKSYADIKDKVPLARPVRKPVPEATLAQMGGILTGDEELDARTGVSQKRKPAHASSPQGEEHKTDNSKKDEVNPAKAELLNKIKQLKGTPTADQISAIRDEAREKGLTRDLQVRSAIHKLVDKLDDSEFERYSHIEDEKQAERREQTHKEFKEAISKPYEETVKKSNAKEAAINDAVASEREQINTTNEFAKEFKNVDLRQNQAVAHRLLKQHPDREEDIRQAFFRATPQAREASFEAAKRGYIKFHKNNPNHKEFKGTKDGLLGFDFNGNPVYSTTEEFFDQLIEDESYQAVATETLAHAQALETDKVNTAEEAVKNSLRRNQFRGKAKEIREEAATFLGQEKATNQDLASMATDREVRERVSQDSILRKFLDYLNKVLASVIAVVAVGAMTIPQDAHAHTGYGTFTQSQLVEGASQKASDTINWVVANKDHGGKEFVVADKENGKILVVSPEGKVLDSQSAIFGKNKGDSNAFGNTPSGRFQLQKVDTKKLTSTDRRVFGDSVLDLTDKETGQKARSTDGRIIAMHRVVNLPERKAALDSASASDNFLSHGCINIPTTFYNKAVDKLDGAMVYVLTQEDGKSAPVTKDTSKRKQFKRSALKWSKAAKDVKAEGVSVDKLSATLEKALGDLSKNVRFVTAKDFADEGAFNTLRNAGVEGFYDADNQQVYLVADSIRADKTLSAEERATWVAWHELFHQGLDVKHGDKLGKVLSDVSNNAFVNNLANAIRIDRMDNELTEITQEKAIEETLAELGAALESNNIAALEQRYGISVPKEYRGETKSFVANALSAMAQVIRKVLGKPTFTHKQVQTLLNEAKQALVPSKEMRDLAKKELEFTHTPDSALSRAVSFSIADKFIEKAKDFRDVIVGGDISRTGSIPSRDGSRSAKATTAGQNALSRWWTWFQDSMQIIIDLDPEGNGGKLSNAVATFSNRAQQVARKYSKKAKAFERSMLDFVLANKDLFPKRKNRKQIDHLVQDTTSSLRAITGGNEKIRRVTWSVLSSVMTSTTETVSLSATFRVYWIKSVSTRNTWKTTGL